MSNKPIRILITENDPVTRDMLHVRLEEAGHVCIHASDGVQAMDLIRQQDFDLVLLEHLLPGMNGREVLRQIRERQEECRLPVILLFKTGEEGLIPGVLQRGASDALTKPLRVTELLVRIDKLLRYRQRLVESEDRLAAVQQELAEKTRLFEQEKKLLETNRKRLRKMIQASPSIVYATRASGDYRCVFVSDRLFEVMGYRPDEMIKSENFWFDHLHPEDEARVTRELLDAIREGHGKLRYRFRHRGGHYLWVEDDFELLHDDQGQPKEIIGAWTDIKAISHLADSPWLRPGDD